MNTTHQLTIVAALPTTAGFGSQLRAEVVPQSDPVMPMFLPCEFAEIDRLVRMLDAINDLHARKMKAKIFGDWGSMGEQVEERPSALGSMESRDLSHRDHLHEG